MKRVSIQELERHLSAIVAEAASGGTILVTRHHRPIARISPAEPAQVHTGKRFGKGKKLVEPLLNKGAKVRILDLLDDDRRGDSDGR